jgi:hypothetical protein
MTERHEPTESERAGKPGDYWWHTYNGRLEFCRDDWDVTEEEYRRHASADDIKYLDDVIARGVLSKPVQPPTIIPQHTTNEQQDDAATRS